MGVEEANMPSASVGTFASSDVRSTDVMKGLYKVEHSRTLLGQIRTSMFPLSRSALA
jgi:hypothetical protein